MKKILIPIVLLLIYSSMAVSQNTNPNHKNFFKEGEQYSNGKCSVHFKDIVAKVDYAKLAMEIENTSNEYIMFNMDEPTFVFDFGSYRSKKKTIFIAPNSSKVSTLKVFGGNQFHVDAFELIVDGLYIIPSKVKAVKLADFSCLHLLIQWKLQVFVFSC